MMIIAYQQLLLLYKENNNRFNVCHGYYTLSSFDLVYFLTHVINSVSTFNMASTQSSSYELDKQFYRLLSLIKNSVENLTNHEHVKVIQIWLEKLCCATDDKRITNQYLFELSKQTETGVFKPPFLHPPPEGPLQPYSCILKVLKPTTINTGSKQNSMRCDYDDSWCDVSDSLSDNASAAGDNEPSSPNVNHALQNQFLQTYEEKILNLNSVIEHLKEENNFLRTQMEARHEELKLYNYQAEKQIHHLHSEVNNLKSKLMELNEAKAAMQNNYMSITKECKINMNVLKANLAETQKQNIELRSIIKVLEDTLHELSLNSVSSIANKEELKQLESKCNNKMAIMEQKYLTQIYKMKYQYETELEELKRFYANKKQDEVAKKIYIRSPKIRTVSHCEDNEIRIKESPVKCNECHEKIEQLQTSLTNLEMLYRKLEHNYSKQITNYKDTNKNNNSKHEIEYSNKETNTILVGNTPSFELINKLRLEILNLLKINRLKHEYEVKEQKNQLALLKEFSHNISPISPKDVDDTFLKLNDFYNNLLEQHIPQEDFVDSKAIRDMQEEIFCLQMQKLDNL